MEVFQILFPVCPNNEDIIHNLTSGGGVVLDISIALFSERFVKYWHYGCGSASHLFAVAILVYPIRTA